MWLLPDGLTFTTSGDIVDMGEGAVFITGDSTITIS